MTLDKLARITANEFSAVRKDLATKADKADLVNLKNDLIAYTDNRLNDYKGEIREIVRDENKKVIESNDKVVTKLDILLKEEGARTEQYKRQEKDISMLKQKLVFK